MQIRLALTVSKAKDADKTFPVGYIPVFVFLFFFFMLCCFFLPVLSVVLAGTTPPNVVCL